MTAMIEQATTDSTPRVAGPRTFTVTAGEDIPRRRHTIYKGATITVDPSPPPRDGDLMLVVFNPGLPSAFLQLVTIYVREDGRPYLDVSSDDYHIVGRAVWFQNPPFDPNAPLEGNVASISDPPEFLAEDWPPKP